MFREFLKHELRSLLKSQRVIWVTTVFAILFFVIFFLRVDFLQKQINQYIQNIEMTEKALNSSINYSFINPRAIRKPKLFSVYNGGFTGDYGDVINTKYFLPITKAEVLNSESNDFYNDTIKMDISFIVTFFLSLLVFLIAYDSVNGEKESGTLRILMTWSFKKILFLYKKILGIFIFVFFVFSLPYILSALMLVVRFGDFITTGFLISYFLYWISVALFIAVISLFGILCSLITRNSNRSLVYSLFIWLLLTIILPVSWDYFIAENIFKNKIALHTNNFRIYTSELINVLKNKPDEANPDKVGHWNWNGGYHYDVNVIGHRWTNEVHRNYMSYIYEYYYPVVKKLEHENLQIVLLKNQREVFKSSIMFFNPVIVFQTLANFISGSSQRDYYQFLNDGINIRDSLIDKGVREKWLFKNDFFYSTYPEHPMPFWPDFVEELNREITEDDGRAFNELMMETYKNTPPYKFNLPEIRRYEQREIILSEVYKNVLLYYLIFIICLIFLLIFSSRLFINFDVR